jgi:predicted GNAT family acetyltransferase
LAYLAKLPVQHDQTSRKQNPEMNYEELKLHINSESNRMELAVGANTAFINYKLSHELLYLIHTEVPEELEGKGVGSAIVLKALQYAKDEHLKIVPLCPFVQAYLKRHPEWNDIVAADTERFFD